MRRAVCVVFQDHFVLSMLPTLWWCLRVSGCGTCFSAVRGVDADQLGRTRRTERCFAVSPVPCAVVRASWRVFGVFQRDYFTRSVAMCEVQSHVKCASGSCQTITRRRSCLVEAARASVRARPRHACRVNVLPGLAYTFAIRVGPLNPEREFSCVRSVVPTTRKT